MQHLASSPEQRLRRLGNVRFIGSLNGRYTLSSRTQRGGGVQVFACRVQSISPKMAVLTAPVCGSQGEWLTAHFPDLGIIRAQISRHLDYGFAVDIAGTDEERAKLGAKINWLKKRVHEAAPDKREHKRTMPRDPRSSLILPNGIKMGCFIIDISMSGVAVSADLNPEIGTPLAIGTVIGRVVRHLDVGFAVKFLALQEAATLEQALVTEWSQQRGEPDASTAVQSGIYV
ncbi:MAG TPA: PilZ domain-containing protein [Arsenicitalea sp.]|nr:PilZ domain-containing protein [Arsenicitalea sp.]